MAIETGNGNIQNNFFKFFFFFFLENQENFFKNKLLIQKKKIDKQQIHLIKSKKIKNWLTKQLA